MRQARVGEHTLPTPWMRETTGTVLHKAISVPGRVGSWRREPVWLKNLSCIAQFIAICSSAKTGKNVAKWDGSTPRGFFEPTEILGIVSQ